jgi:hypothetical protein
MAVKVKITPFEKTIKLVLDRNLSPQARSQRVAAFARTEIVAADEQNRLALGTAPPKTVTVDGRQGAPLESVNPDRGVIVAEWRLVGDVLIWIMATLKQRSPVISGKYRDSHTLFADGAETDAGNAPLAEEYTFLNPVPYSRKIEFGKTESGRDFVIQVPNRIYERTASDAKARFGNIAKIRFSYQSSVGSGKRRDDRVPAIVVTLK